MLNNLKLKLKNYNLYKQHNKSIEVGQAKHHIPGDKEWFNSIYAYNKNTLKSLPVADKVILKYIKAYFNLYSPTLENNAKLPYVRRRFKRLSTNRILVSKAELKHTSDKVIVTIYVYNRQRSYYLRRLINIPGAIVNLNEKDYFIEKTKFSNLFLRKIKKLGLKIMLKVYKQKSLIKTLENNNKFRSYERKYLKNLLLKCLQREMLLMYHRQIILFNKSKFEKTYLLPLTNLISNVYNKKIEFNLVDLKYLYLNSYIFSETLATKIRNRKNKVLKVLKNSLMMFNLAPLDKLSILNDISVSRKQPQNLKINYLESENANSDSNLNALSLSLDKKPFYTLKDKMHMDTHYTTKNILNSIKHKSVTGIRIEAAGRLTKRNTAAKSLFKLRYIGNLKNVDSSYKGFSSVLLRGHAKSNVQYTKLKSKLRIGSFGLKGWISAN